MKRIALITLAVLAFAAIAAWWLLRGETWTLTFTQQQIEEQLAKRFPMSKQYLVVFNVQYENPRVRLTEGSSDVHVGLDARLDGSVYGKEIKGSADIVTKIAYDAESATYVLHDARLLKLDIAGLKPELADEVKSLANKLVAERVSGLPIYELQPNDLKTASTRLVLKSVAVRDGVLHVVVGL
jgi:hypothetical protein